jgi:DNA-binding LacI/PurR family transcriptional regulator
MRRERAPTIRDVAAKASVSIATVSRVVNRYPHVRPEVRERVQQAIAALGYRANGLASSFRTQQSRLVGVFLRQQRTPFSSALGYAIESTMFDAGYRTLLCSTTGDADREESYVHSMIEMRAEGVIIRPTAATARTMGHVGLLRQAELLLANNPAITAIFATTDILAIGAMQAAHRLGIRVPEELSILGYDGIMESNMTFPTLTTIRQPINEMGELAARTLLTQIRRPDAPAQQIVLENTLLLRDSTARAKNLLDL